MVPVTSLVEANDISSTEGKVMIGILGIILISGSLFFSANSQHIENIIGI